MSDEYFRTENIRLWRTQTRTTTSDHKIENYVYTYSADEPKTHKSSCFKNMGDNAYLFLLFAKLCEKARDEMNDP
mgnify:CR=1